MPVTEQTTQSPAGANPIESARRKLIVALDVPDAASALSLVDRLGASCGFFKVGLELFTGSGPSVVEPILRRGHRVFLDLKFHGIPNTVAGAVRSAAALGVWMVNVHASGGPAMLEAARRAADEGGPHRPLVIAVTVLTSLDQAALTAVGVGTSPAAQVARLAALTEAAGLDGVVASPQ